MVKKKEWKHVTPDMMSEEDNNSEFIRHSPSWRSQPLNQFLKKLETRFKLKHEKSLAKPRSYGSQKNISAPIGIPSWMIEAEDSSMPVCENTVSVNESRSENNDSDEKTIIIHDYL